MRKAFVKGFECRPEKPDACYVYARAVFDCKLLKQIGLFKFMAHIAYESLNVKEKRILCAVFHRFLKHRCDILYLDITVSFSYVFECGLDNLQLNSICIYFDK